MSRITSILFALVISITVSCSKKDTSTPEAAEYYFRFKVDGKQVEFPYRTGIEHNLIGHVNLTGSNPTVGNYHVVNIAGMRTIAEGGALNNYKNNVSIFMQQADRFETGIAYTNVAGGSGQVVGQIFLISYYDGNGLLHGASHLANNAYSTYGNAHIQLDEITNSHVKGRFWGTLEAREINGLEVTVTSTVDITDGTFFVPSSFNAP